MLRNCLQNEGEGWVKTGNGMLGRVFLDVSSPKVKVAKAILLL
jgi:hypothetical protein